MVNDPTEMIYVTVHYACKDDMLRTIRLDDATHEQRTGRSREIFSPEQCWHCDSIKRSLQEARSDRKMGGRY